MAESEPLPSPPFVDVPGIHNFRDIGGYKAANGSRVRSGFVFRSADPTKATEAGLVKMSKDLGMKTIFDLRSTPELQRAGPEWGGVAPTSSELFEPYGIERLWTPVFADKDYGPEQVALRYKEYTRSGTEGFVQAYRDILKAGTTSYAKIFRYLADGNPSALPPPCLVHCTAGKDRTGVIVALLLELVGVDGDTIADDYSLTQQGLAPLRPLFIERLLRNPVLAGNRDGVENMVSAKRENMVATLEMIAQEFGGAENYMRKDCGLNDDEIEQLKANLVEA